MSLITKKILLYIVTALLAICLGLVICSFVFNASKSALAQDFDKPVVEWESKSSSKFDIVDNGDGSASLVGAKIGFSSTSTNPYSNVIKKTIIPENLYEGSNVNYTSLSFIVKYGEIPTYHDVYKNVPSSYHQQYQYSPRVMVCKDYLLVSNGWAMVDNTQKITVNYQKNGVNTSIEYGKPYTFWLNFADIIETGIVVGYDVYVKVEDANGVALVDETIHLYKVCSYMTSSLAVCEEIDLVLTNSITPFNNGTNYTFREILSDNQEKLFFDDIVHDEDISYYWKEDGITNNRVGKYVTNKDGACTTFGADKAFWTPDFDNRWTFKLVANNDWGYFTSQSFTYTNSAGEIKGPFDAGAIRIGLGQRYSDYGFKIDYLRDKITLSCAKSSLGSTTVDFDLDYTKEYRTSIVIRDVRDSEGTLKYRLQVLDMVEIGNEDNNITVTNLTDFLVTYGNSATWNGSSCLPKHMRLTNGNDHNSIPNSPLHENSDGCEFYLISLNISKYVTINGTTQKMNIANIQLPTLATDGMFVGYTCVENGKLYKAGTADLSSYTNSSFTFNPVFLSSVPKVLTFTDMRLVNVALCFKFEFSSRDSEFFNQFATINFFLKKDGVIIDCEQEALSDSDKTMLTLTTDILGANDYSSLFVASATFTIDYANGAETINAIGSCTNSAVHIADFALKNPLEFGVDSWSDAYTEEFERIILLGGTQ